MSPVVVRALVSTLLVSLLMLSCSGKKSSAYKTNIKADPRDEVRTLLAAAYDAVERNDAARLTALLTPNVMGFGLGPDETFSTSSDVGAAFKKAGAEGLEITPQRIRVGVASSNQSAWVWDMPKVRRGDSKVIFLPRVTAHAIRIDGVWRFDAFHVSLGVPDAVAYAPEATTQFSPPNDVLAERGKDADQLVGLAKRTLDDIGVKVDRASEREEVGFVGTDPGEVIEGGRFFRDLLKPKVAEIKRRNATLYKVDGPLRANIAPDGKTGYLAGRVVLRVTADGKKQITLPTFRVLWLFEESGGIWNLVFEHQSLPLKDEQRVGASPDELKLYGDLERATTARIPKAKIARDARGLATFE